MTIEMKLQEKLEEGIELGEKRGIELGERNKSLEIARNFLSMGIDVAQVSKATGLSVEELRQFQL